MIVRVEHGTLPARRPRAAGANARIGVHGREFSVPLVRITADDGAWGVGVGRPTDGDIHSLLRGEEPRVFEFALVDLRARRRGRPVGAAITVPCYDTSLTIDDLEVRDDAAAAALIGGFAANGYDRGHRTFKIKVGRGARHMDVEEGLRRDVAVVHGVREAVGPEATILLDANNGLTLNLAKRMLDLTSECVIGWLEEPFHEDAALLEDLHAWIADRELPTLLADGEWLAPPYLLEWAHHGWLDVVQFDIIGHGFNAWLRTGAVLDGMDARSAPHHFGTWYGNYVACHLAGAIRNFAYAEWDEATVDGASAPGYEVRDGYVRMPQTPGFGIELDDVALRSFAVTTRD